MQITEARLANLLKKLGINAKLRGYVLQNVLEDVLKGNVTYNTKLRASSALRLCRKQIEERYLDLSDLLEEIEES